MQRETLARVERQLRIAAGQDGINHFVVGVAVFRSGKLLMIRRVPDDFHGGMYELPGGGVEPGETFADCTARELFEETGLQLSGITGFLGSLDYATRTKPRVRKFSFLAEVELGDVVLAPGEHDAFAWADAEAMDELPMTPDMRESVRTLVEHTPLGLAVTDS